MSELLKDQIDVKFIKNLADKIWKECSSFPKKKFVAQLSKEQDWNNLELKERVRAITISLNRCIDGEYSNKIEILKKIAPKTQGLGALIFPDFVEIYGIAYWSTSIKALKYFTPFFSSEFAVRPFIIKDQSKMLKVMSNWAKDKNYKVRRLASEGCRPRLPWGVKLHQLVSDPKPILPILEDLKFDPELFVRRSVANNLNDISKDHPNLVLNLSKKWLGKNRETDWVVKHGLRTLLKKGDKKALSLFSLKPPKNLSIDQLKLTKQSVSIGSNLEFSFQVENSNNTAKKIRIDYLIHYLKKNGSYSKKSFKVTEKTLEPKEVIGFKKGHSFRQMSTRTHYIGKHYLEITLNGVALSKASFKVS